MLLRITNRCEGRCSHCMIDGSSPDGEHMDMSTFDKALDFCRRASTAILLVSGGEPFEHPDVFDMLNKIKDGIGEVTLAFAVTSNGHFALNPDLYKKVIESGVWVQVTCDPRFYPRVLRRELYRHPRITFEDQIRVVYPCRRVKEAGITTTRRAPSCFNMRSVTRSMGFRHGAAHLAMVGRPCTPSINVDGSVRAGEMDTCFRLGTVDSSIDEIEESLSSMKCGRCGLGAGLSPRELAAIGGQV